jgi:hypothetical protein
MINRADTLLSAAKPIVVAVNTLEVAHSAFGTVGIVKTATDCRKRLSKGAWVGSD